MTEAYVISFAQSAAMITLILAGPVLITSLLIGLLVSIFQTATSINEATLTFIPKIVGVALVLAILGSWMAQKLIAFSTNVFTSLPT